MLLVSEFEWASDKPSWDGQQAAWGRMEGRSGGSDGTRVNQSTLYFVSPASKSTQDPVELIDQNSGWRHQSSLSTNASREACSLTLHPVEPINQMATVGSGLREGGGHWWSKRKGRLMLVVIYTQRQTWCNQMTQSKHSKNNYINFFTMTYPPLNPRALWMGPKTSRYETADRETHFEVSWLSLS